MSVFISDTDKAQLYVKFCYTKQPQNHCQWTILKCSLQFHWSVDLNSNMNKTLNGRLQELKNKGKVLLGKSQKWSLSLLGVVAYESFSLQSLTQSSNGVSERWL